jgi:hypothetical protein
LSHSASLTFLVHNMIFLKKLLLFLFFNQCCQRFFNFVRLQRTDLGFIHPLCCMFVSKFINLFLTLFPLLWGRFISSLLLTMLVSEVLDLSMKGPPNSSCLASF